MTKDPTEVTALSILAYIAARHNERMKNDTLYRHTFAVMQEATKAVRPPRHCDRDGYCDNPARGY